MLVQVFTIATLLGVSHLPVPIAHKKLDANNVLMEHIHLLKVQLMRVVFVLKFMLKELLKLFINHHLKISPRNSPTKSAL